MAACLAAAAIAGVAAPASAQTGSRLGDALLGRQTSPSQPAQAAPTVARYVAERGPSFILDQSGSTILFRFENSPEVWALQSRPGSSGDVMFLNDLGRPVLRATRLGGLILYSEVRPEGLPASLSGPAAPIQAVFKLDPRAFFAAVDQANIRMAAAARRSSDRGMKLEIPPVRTTASAAALIVDTTTLLADAFERIAKRPGGLELLNDVDKVQVGLTTGQSTISFSQGVLRVNIRPDEGAAGRPSSEKMVVTLMGR